MKEGETITAKKTLEDLASSGLRKASVGMRADANFHTPLGDKRRKMVAAVVVEVRREEKDTRGREITTRLPRDS